MYNDYCQPNKNPPPNNPIPYLPLNVTEQAQPLQNNYTHNKIETSRPRISEPYTQDSRRNSQSHHSPARFSAAIKPTNNPALSNYLAFLQNRPQILKEQKQTRNQSIGGNTRSFLTYTNRQISQNEETKDERSADSKQIKYPLPSQRDSRKDTQKYPSDRPQLASKTQQISFSTHQPYSYQRYQNTIGFSQFANIKFNPAPEPPNNKNNNPTFNTPQQRTPQYSNHKNTDLSSMTQNAIKNNNTTLNSVERKHSYYRTSDFLPPPVNELEQSKIANFSRILSIKGSIDIHEPKTLPSNHDGNQIAPNYIRFEQDIKERNKEISIQNRELSEKSKLIIDKNRQIQSLSTKLVALNEQIAKDQAEWSQKQKEYLRTIQTIEQDSNRRTEQEIKLHESQFHKQMVSLELTISTTTKELQQKATQMGKLTQQIQHLQTKLQRSNTQKDDLITIIRLTEQQLIQSNKEKQQLLTNHQKQQQIQSAQIQTLSQQLRLLEEQNTSLDTRLSNQQIILDDLEQINAKYAHLAADKTALEISLQSLSQQLNLQSTQNGVLTQEKDETSQKLAMMEEKYREAVRQLKSLKKSRENIDKPHENDDLQTKELQKSRECQMQRLQTEHLDRRCQQLGRELKHSANLLTATNNMIEQTSHLIHNINQEIVLTNLLSLNEKYKDLEASE